MAENDWIEWRGGDRPHPPQTLVEIRLRNGQTGQTGQTQSAFYWWWHDGHGTDIVAYRVLPAPSSVSLEEALDALKQVRDSGVPLGTDDCPDEAVSGKAMNAVRDILQRAGRQS